MPDPTTEPVDFHDWLTWYERRKGGRRHRRRRMDQRAAMAELQAAADETYQLGLYEILQVTARPNFVPGLLNSPPGAPLQRWELEGCRIDLIQRVERQGAHLEQWVDVVLSSRMTGELQYFNLRFRLAKPAALAAHLAGKPRQPPSISLEMLVRLLLEDKIFQRHRDEHLLPAANFLKAVAELHYPDFAVPRDNRLRVALGQSVRSRDRPDPRVRAMYGEPQSGPPPKWARDLLISLKIGRAP
jgi:hypothetical protein